MLFIPQGHLTGEPYRFACYLNAANSLSMALIDKWSCDGRQNIPQNYFDEASIELLPDSLLNFAIHLRTNNESFECCSLSLIWETKPGKINELAVALPRKACVYALDQIPEDQRFRRTYDTVAPWIALEDDAQFPSCYPYCWY